MTKKGFLHLSRILVLLALAILFVNRDWNGSIGIAHAVAVVLLVLAVVAHFWSI